MADTKSGQGQRRVLTGRVVSNKMDKTAVVRVERLLQHPLLGKRIRRHKKYYAHDEKNECNIGDLVRITECRPMSKMKCWRLTEIMARAK